MIRLTTEQAQQIEEALMKIADLRNLGKIQPEVIAFETLYIIRAVRAQEQAEQSSEAATPTTLAEPVAFVSDVYQSRYTLEWNGRSLPVGTLLYDHSLSLAVRQELEHKAEEAECAKLSLDKAGVPTADASGKAYSLWGRVCRYVEQAEQEPVGRWNWNEAKFEWLTKFDYHKHHMTPLYAAPQPVMQEPVAWAHPSGGYLSARYMKEFATGLEKETYTIPLYAATQPVQQEPLMDYERINALREGEQNGAEDAYFFVRPENDTPSLRKMFCQGFERGFHKGLKYASHVRTKDLTDEEQLELARSSVGKSRHWLVAAVIAAYKEKNRG